MECEETKSFLAKLAHWDDEEIEDKLKQRVEFRLVIFWLNFLETDIGCF